AVKANSNLAILNRLAKLGSGFDTVSGGEIYRALKAGAEPRKIVYAGVGKTREEIKYALESNILVFNAESTQELFAIDEVAGGLGKKAQVALRVNPDIDAATHPYITTGMKNNKFGVDIDTALNDYKLAATLRNINIIGIHQHIGSQITEGRPFVDALERVIAFADTLKAEGINIKYLNIGGGLGITYKDETPLHPKELAKLLVPLLKKSGYKIIFEPGRVIAGNAGVLVTKVLYTKSSGVKNFLIVDAGMNDLIRPSIYGAHHEIVSVDRNKSGKEKVVDVVGPICESGDFIAKDRSLPIMESGDLMAVMSAGAYGFTMSSNYNSRRRAAEVLVSGDTYNIVRERESLEDLTRGEIIPE
ncbi:MAG: diaminopimelate decarboxylase, partial [Nitrospinae bacterium]|nr:diaminopimelate decarboxylase [Nitrospinota bacterium]